MEELESRNKGTIAESFSSYNKNIITELPGNHIYDSKAVQHKDLIRKSMHNKKIILIKKSQD